MLVDGKVGHSATTPKILVIGLSWMANVQWGSVREAQSEYKTGSRGWSRTLKWRRGGGGVWADKYFKDVVQGCKMLIMYTHPLSPVAPWSLQWFYPASGIICCYRQLLPQLLPPHGWVVVFQLPVPILVALTHERLTSPTFASDIGTLYSQFKLKLWSASCLSFFV